jgi:hypothetical protein
MSLRVQHDGGGAIWSYALSAGDVGELNASRAPSGVTWAQDGQQRAPPACVGGAVGDGVCGARTHPSRVATSDPVRAAEGS